MAYPPVVIVDENDKVVGSAMLADAWEKSLIHRIVFVIIENREGRVLLHKRADDMKLYPGRWDTAGGHVDVTPDPKESARIELREEVGIDDVELTEVAHFYCDEPYDNGVCARRFIYVYHTDYDGQPGKLGDGEAVDTKWFGRSELADLAGKHPELVAEGLFRCLPYILKDDENNRNQATGQENGSLLHIR